MHAAQIEECSTHAHASSVRAGTTANQEPFMLSCGGGELAPAALGARINNLQYILCKPMRIGVRGPQFCRCKLATIKIICVARSMSVFLASQARPCFCDSARLHDDECWELEKRATGTCILGDSLHPHISSEHRDVKIHLLDVAMIW